MESVDCEDILYRWSEDGKQKIKELEELAKKREENKEKNKEDNREEE